MTEPLEIHFSEFDEYIRQGEPDQKERASNWSVAIGLQAVDQLHVSQYLLKTASEHIEGLITQDEVEQRISAYYQTEESRQEEAGTDEADQVSSRIIKVLGTRSFTFSPSHYASIHRQLFSGILPHAGTYRNFDITKKEWILNNASVLYGAADYISETLRYDFGEEQKYSYKHKQPEEVIEHFSTFIAGIWQIHPFREGNTRTTAVFAIQYLRSLGYAIDNTPFKEHSWYFRNALVRANYDNLPLGITRTTEYLELFFRNFLLGEHNELKNRYLHVNWKTSEKHEKVAEKSAKSSVQNTKTSEKKQKTSEKIIALLRTNNALSAADLGLQLGRTPRAIEMQLEKLRTLGFIRRIGPDKGGHWEVIQ